MKRMLSLIMALAIMLSMVPVVLAAEPTFIDTGVVLTEVKAYELTLDGENDFTCYYFKPVETGVYKLSVSSGAEIGEAGYYWAYAPSKTSTYLEFECTDASADPYEGQGVYIGISSIHSEITLTIERTGDAEIYIPPVEWELQHTPNAANAVSGSLMAVSVLTSHTSVLGADGYYHLDAADGPVLYVDMKSQKFNIMDSAQPAVSGGGGAMSLSGYYNDVNYEFKPTIVAYAAVMGNARYYPLTEDLRAFLWGYCYGGGQWTANGNDWVLPAGYDYDTAWMVLCAYDKNAAPSTHTHQLTEQKAVAATCTQAGKKVHYTCTCGQLFADAEGKTPITASDLTVPAAGHKEVADAAVAATCTEPGLTAGKHCSVCKEVLVKQNVVPAKGHKWDNGVVTLEPTEQTEGKKLFTCTVCGEQKETAIPVKDHVHAYTAVVTAPTCTEAGYTTYTCTCGDSYKGDQVKALGHKEVADTAVAATCTESGLTAGKHCSVCKAVLVKQEVVPALGHKEVADAAVAATCTESGLTAGKHCSVCKAVLVKQEVIPALGHKEVADAAVAATCTESGLTAGKHCSVCQTILVKQEAVPAKGHKWDDGVITLEPTEETEGKRVHTCTVCGEKKEVTIPSKDHVHAYTAAVTAPTCTEQGYTTYTCTCGDSYKDNYVKALGHKIVADAAVAPTCTAAGLTAGEHCDRCGEVLVKQESIPAKGHDYQLKNEKEPTETEEGYTGDQICAVCGDTIKGESIPAIKPEKPGFSDVKPDAYYADAVMWAVENGITAGTSDTTFSPNNPCTRGQVVLFLWRANGSPAPKNSENPFQDVKPTDYFYEAVLWAVESNITAGVSENEFGPRQEVTRAQFLTFLWSAMNQPDIDRANPFNDVPNGRYYTKPILWALENGITSGVSATEFGTQMVCERSHVVTFLYNAYGK